MSWEGEKRLMDSMTLRQNFLARCFDTYCHSGEKDSSYPLQPCSWYCAGWRAGAEGWEQWYSGFVNGHNHFMWLNALVPYQYICVVSMVYILLMLNPDAKILLKFFSESRTGLSMIEMEMVYKIICNYGYKFKNWLLWPITSKLCPPRRRDHISGPWPSSMRILTHPQHAGTFG